MRDPSPFPPRVAVVVSVTRTGAAAMYRSRRAKPLEGISMSTTPELSAPRLAVRPMVPPRGTPHIENQPLLSETDAMRGVLRIMPEDVNETSCHSPMIFACGAGLPSCALRAKPITMAPESGDADGPQILVRIRCGDGMDRSRRCVVPART